MIKAILSLLTPDPVKKLSKIKDRKYKQAVHLQRNGDLRAYAAVMNDIAALEEEILRLIQTRNDQ